jgi:hypothetical protein
MRVFSASSGMRFAPGWSAKRSSLRPYHPCGRDIPAPLTGEAFRSVRGGRLLVREESCLRLRRFLRPRPEYRVRGFYLRRSRSGLETPIYHAEASLSVQYSTHCMKTIEHWREPMSCKMFCAGCLSWYTVQATPSRSPARADPRRFRMAPETRGFLLLKPA